MYDPNCSGFWNRIKLFKVSTSKRVIPVQKACLQHGCSIDLGRISSTPFKSYLSLDFNHHVLEN